MKKPNERGVTIRGVECDADGFRPFFETHRPCSVDAATLRSNRFADHRGCTVTQRFVGPTYRTIEEAVSAAERAEVTTKNGKTLRTDDWKRVGS